MEPTVQFSTLTSNHIHTLPSSSVFSFASAVQDFIGSFSILFHRSFQIQINITSFDYSLSISFPEINAYFKDLSPMPGTIQVSVLDYAGLPSSSSPSAVSIRVSMGKRGYQTWDRGDFSFPLSTLRQNLTVTLLDTEGNEISHADIDTMLVIQKGLLDDIFPLNGGGHVHMKLQFILSEEERNRIRIMRESAMKKKQSELSGSVTSSSLSTNMKVSDSQRDLIRINTKSIRATATRSGVDQNSVNFSVEQQSNADKIGEILLDDCSTALNDTDRTGESLSTSEVSQEAGACHLTELEHTDIIEKVKAQSPFSDAPLKPAFSGVASSISASLQSVAANIGSASPRHVQNHVNYTEKQSSLKKSPSNVRKMISAFENSLIQETEHHVAPPVLKSKSPKSWKKVLLRGPQKLEETETWNLKQTQSTSEEAKDSVLLGEFQQTASYIRNVTPSDKNREVHKKEEKKSSENLIQRFPVETSTASGGMFNHWGKRQPSNLVTDERDSGGTSVREKDGAGVQSKFSCEIISEGYTENTTKPVVYHKAQELSFESCSSCAFPDDTRRLCITTSDKQVMNLMGGSLTNVDIDQKKVHGSTDIEGKQGQRESKRLASSAESGPSKDPFAQVIKIAIIAGFGTFVFLTRQRSRR